MTKIYNYYCHMNMGKGKQNTLSIPKACYSVCGTINPMVDSCSFTYTSTHWILKPWCERKRVLMTTWGQGGVAMMEGCVPYFLRRTTAGKIRKCSSLYTICRERGHSLRLWKEVISTICRGWIMDRVGISSGASPGMDHLWGFWITITMYPSHCLNPLLMVLVLRWKIPITIV